MKRRLGRLFCLSWLDQETGEAKWEMWGEADDRIDTVLFVICLTLIGILFISVLIVWSRQ